MCAFAVSGLVCLDIEDVSPTLTVSLICSMETSNPLLVSKAGMTFGGSLTKPARHPAQGRLDWRRETALRRFKRAIFCTACRRDMRGRITHLLPTTESYRNQRHLTAFNSGKISRKYTVFGSQRQGAKSTPRDSLGRGLESRPGHTTWLSPALLPVRAKSYSCP